MLKQNAHVKSLFRKGEYRSGSGPQVAAQVSGDLRRYPSSLNFYFQPPEEEMSIEDLGQCALARKRILETIHRSKNMSLPQKQFEEELEKIIQRNMHLSRKSRTHIVGVETCLLERIRDNASHYILRLYYCKSPEDRLWFATNEAELLAQRLRMEDRATKNEFFWTIFRNVKLLDPNEKTKNMKDLCGLHGLNEFEIRNMDFYVIPFQNAMSLISKRKVLFLNGLAYVPSTEKVSVIITAFKSYILKQMGDLSKILPQINDEKVRFIIDLLDKSTLKSGTQATINTGSNFLAWNDVEGVVKYFPPCMKNIQKILEKNGHLKHQDRVKYGLFLKWAGMPYEEALTFWEKSMHSIPKGTFQNDYMYYVRYNYGLEGKRKDFQPWSCRDMLNRVFLNGNHGCPFREMSDLQLEDFLDSNYQCGVKTARNLTKNASSGNYQALCSTLLSSVITPQDSVIENKETIESKNIIESPNDFYNKFIESITKNNELH